MTTAAEAPSNIGVTTHRIGDVELAVLMAAAETALDALMTLDTTHLVAADHRSLLARTDRLSRKIDSAGHTWIAEIVQRHALDDLPGSIPHALADLLHTSTRDASDRLKDSRTFGPRTGLSGDALEPRYPRTAAASREGAIGSLHRKVIADFFSNLSDSVDPQTRERAEDQLADLARLLRPEAFKGAAAYLFRKIDQDGKPPKDTGDKARKRFIKFGEQDADGYTDGTFRVDAETRALLEVVQAKWAKYGANNPDTTTPNNVTPDTDDESGSATEKSAPDQPSFRDMRTPGQRLHDAVKRMLTEIIASGALGTHRGVRATPIVIMTLKELEAATGLAVTATGTTLTIPDALRMAAGAHPYLLLIDHDGRPLHLGRGARLANEDQRLTLYATERGCSFPGCMRPGTMCQVHHTKQWFADSGGTDIDDLTLACEQHHALVGPDEHCWATTIAGPDHPQPGRTLWHPPVSLDPTRVGKVNHFFHPSEYFYQTGAAA